MPASNLARASRDEPTTKRKVLTFALGKESYGIDIEHVTEIIGLQKITPVPDMPAYVRGVINLRGRVIPVMDVRLRFGLERKDSDARTCIVVISVATTDIGLLVDTVQEVLDIPSNEIADPPGIRTAARSFVSAMAKVGDDVKVILDADALLFHDHLDTSREPR